MAFFGEYDLASGFGPKTTYSPDASLSDAFSPTSRGYGTYAALDPRTARRSGMSAEEWTARIQGWITDGSQIFRSFDRPSGTAPPPVVVQRPAAARAQLDPTLIIGAGLAVVVVVLLTQRRR